VIQNFKIAESSAVP